MSRLDRHGKIAGAVADGSPTHPWARKPVPQLGAPSVVPMSPNSRLGRNASPHVQGRDMETIYVDIDVAKDRLDVHVRPSDEAFAVARDGEGLAALVERLVTLAPALIVLEATGGFVVTV